MKTGVNSNSYVTKTELERFCHIDTMSSANLIVDDTVDMLKVLWSSLVD